MNKIHILSNQETHTLETIYHDLVSFYYFNEPEIINSIIGNEDFTKEEIQKQIETCLYFDKNDKEMNEYLIELIELMDDVEEDKIDRFYSMLSTIQLCYYYGEELLKTNEQVIVCFMGVYLKTSRKELKETCSQLLNPCLLNPIIEDCEDDIEETYQYLYEKKIELMEQDQPMKKRLLS